MHVKYAVPAGNDADRFGFSAPAQEGTASIAR